MSYVGIGGSVSYLPTARLSSLTFSLPSQQIKTPSSSSDFPNSAPLLAMGNGVQDLRELTFVSNVRQLLITNGSLFFGNSKRIRPRLLQAGTVASAFLVNQNVQQLRRATHQEGVFSLLRNLSTQKLETLVREFTPIEKSLADLSATLDKLSANGGALTALTTSGGDPLVAAFITDPTARPGTHRVRVDRVATAQSVETTGVFPNGVTISNFIDSSGKPITTGNEFTFTINGVQVKASSSDSLATLATKINFGEDLNRNGVLDTNSRFVTEEDVNQNGILDGGTAAHGVRAEVDSGRLRLTRNSEGAQTISVTDQSGLLEALGLIRIDSRGLQVFSREITPAGGATLSVDATVFERPTNSINDIITGVRLELRQAGTETVKIKIANSLEKLAGELETLAASFNQTSRVLNHALGAPLSGLLKKNEKANRLYLNLLQAVDAPVAGQPASLSLPADVGFSLREGRRVTFHAVQLASGLARLQTNSFIPLLKARSPATIFNALDQLGISVADNNTLVVDRGKLSRALTTDAAAVGSLFRAKGGVLERLVKTVRQATDPVSGLISFAKLRLRIANSADFSQTITQTLQRQQEAAFRAGLAENSQTVLSKLA